jgi:hypothetical protein
MKNKLSILIFTFFVLFWSMPAYWAIAWNTGTGLDKLVNIIRNDEWLQNRVFPKSEIKKNQRRKITQEDIDVWARNANEMNRIIIYWIKATWIANDWVLTAWDIIDLNYYINKNFFRKWISLHWNDEKTYESGFHRVQGDGWNTILFWENAINTVADDIYHLWFIANKRNNRILNEDWNNNATFSLLAYRLSNLLEKELQNGSLKNDSIVEVKNIKTNTSLDKIVDYIKNDIWLNQRVKTSDIMKWARSANEMNKILVEAMKMTWAANDNFISVDDVKAMHVYIVQNYKDKWINLHWVDNGVYKTWFNLVVWAGASKKIYGRNAVNQVFEGIYNLGFSTDNDYRTKNEKWKYSVWFNSISEWLNALMWDSLKQNNSLSNKFFNWLTIKSWNWEMINTWYKWHNIDRVWIALINNEVKKWNTLISLKMNFRPDGKNEDGSIVFDYKDNKNYKIVWGRSDWNYWEVGEVVNWKYNNFAKFKEKISVNQDYKIDIVFKGNYISLFVDNKPKIKTFIHMSSQKIWYLVNRSYTEFKNLVVQHF